MASTYALRIGHDFRDQGDSADTGIAHVEGFATSNPTIAPDNFCSPNDSIAANLATTLTTTPTRPTPNSARKRRQIPDLTRPTATLGHGAKMSMIFRNAATSLRDHRLSTSQPSSNIKKSRLSLSQARSFKFGSTGKDGTGVSSGPCSSSKISQHLSQPCHTAYASSKAAHYQDSGVSPYHLTSTLMSKTGRVTVGTLTDKYPGVATPVGGLRTDETPRFGRSSLSSRFEDDREKPISSVFETPTAPNPNVIDYLEEVKYPILKGWSLLRSSSNASSLGSDNDELHSTHDVPFILPFPGSNAEEAPHPAIDTWLNGVIEATSSGLLDLSMHSCGTEDLLMDDVRLEQSMNSELVSQKRPRVSPSQLKPNLRSPSGASSNKENLTPLKYSPSPSPISSPEPNLELDNSFHFGQTLVQTARRHPNIVHSARPLIPQGHLSLPPKRKRSHIDEISSSKAEAETVFARRDFTIHDDQLSGALAQLSPHVERYRKGRGPKKERCASYWDQDILVSGLQCAPLDAESNDIMVGREKQVLRESEVAEDLITDQPLAQDARSTDFQLGA